jgi:hypothetical protein
MFDCVLERRGVSYMLIDGQAVLLHGEPRLTRDIDVTLGIGPDRLPEILQLVQACGWRIWLSFLIASWAERWFCPASTRK